MPAVKLTSTPQQKRTLRAASSASIETTFRELKPYFRNSRWLPNNNRYRDDCVESLHADQPNNIHQDSLVRYIAASALPHVLDGWGFVGRAINAYVRGDFVSCRHLAYYAELRATMGLLASQGIGIFNKSHYVVDDAGSAKRVPNNDSTHLLAWKALDHWSGLSRSTDLLSSVITPGGIAISEWQSGIFSDAGFRIVGRNWLKRWNLDVQQCANDQKLRNLSSYRPSRLIHMDFHHVSQRVGFVKEFWRLCEPSGAEPFQRLDRHLLRMWLRDQYSLLRPGQTNSDNPAFVREMSDLIEQVNPQGLSKELWMEFLCSPVKHPDSVVLSMLDQNGKRDAYASHVGMLARALMLLRLATGASRQLLINSGVEKTRLHFWWHNLGAELALWDDGKEPDEPQSLWLDVEQAIAEMELWVLTGDQSHIRSFRTNESSALVVIDELERVGLWGIGL